MTYNVSNFPRYKCGVIPVECNIVEKVFSLGCTLPIIKAI